ncbi:MAG TPA: hypothetical protein VK929_05165 [Longimicrobiales bacterium]|nr:hypothetical protein [Longimicrobiales bacterium]
MANTETTTSRKQGGTNILPVAVALVAVAVFIGWLATRESPEPVAVEEPDAPTDVVADDQGPATVIEDPDVLSGAGAREYVNRSVQLDNTAVITALGSRLVWIELPNGSPYLVLLPEGTATPSGQVTLTGMIREKTDAVLDEWEQSGVLESDDHRLQAEYGSTYFEARQVQPAG